MPQCSAMLRGMHQLNPDAGSRFVTSSLRKTETDAGFPRTQGEFRNWKVPGPDTRRIVEEYLAAEPDWRLHQDAGLLSFDARRGGRSLMSIVAIR